MYCITTVVCPGFFLKQTLCTYVKKSNFQLVLPMKIWKATSKVQHFSTIEKKYVALAVQTAQTVKSIQCNLDLVILSSDNL